ncbi:MAG: flagellar basal body P-ring protein FlgI [Calditrichaeota bacterium]|nr:MAG: flagellar basal body P-ring protein FlgI [Calditrichota bacterium]MBL1204036.1 flagellar basal body P-ring protein FlgI [Calditrichota bacterium]NOG43867.1 flagellar basal body P-ring protein FlgI [Calditrichota bacterium]
MKLTKKIFTTLFLSGMIIQTLSAQVRIKDIVTVENSQQTALIGYGLVVGLGGTGDRSSGNRGAVFTVQTISNMLERFGITVPKEQLRTRNVAAVMVTAKVRPFSIVGSQFDVVVSSLGDASSLEGGVLLPTPLMDTAGNNFAMSQGPLSIGGYNVETKAGEQLRKNHALVGRVPNGASLTQLPPNQSLDISKPLHLFLIEPDFSTASRIAEAINGGADQDSSGSAQALGPGIVEIKFPDSLKTQMEAMRYLSSIEVLPVVTDVEARVVINERTGTIVAGGAVSIGEVMISHGSLTIHTQSAPVISQPNQFSSGGQTVVAQVTNTVAEEADAQSAVINETTTVTDLALALNTIGLKPRDIIAVFQAIKQAGALRARLIIN